MEHPYALPVDAVIASRYRIKKILGAGGFGITYLAHDHLLGQDFALKECFPSDTASRNLTVSQKVFALPNRDQAFQKYKENFHKEAQILAMLSFHSGIVSVRDLIAENNTWYIKMDYLNGRTLYSYLNENGPIDPIEMLKMSKAVLYALDLVHEKGLLHRDIAPDNIMLMEDHSLKVLDFGAAAIIGDGQPTHTLGKEGFAPIEQYNSSNKLTPAADIYAMCATIYNMITGITPDTAPNRLMSIHTTGKDTVARLKELLPDVPAEIDAILHKGMQLNEKARYQSAQEMAEAIEKYLQSLRAKVYVEYYYDGICDPAKTDVFEKTKFEVISTYREKVPDGYQFARAVNLPLTVSTEAVNVIEIYYERIKECCCITHYYYDNELDKEHTYRELKPVNTIITQYIPQERNGYELDHVDGLPLTVSHVTRQNTICVYYKKQKLDRQVCWYYYLDGKKAESRTKIGTMPVGSIIDHFEPLDENRYLFDHADGLPLTVDLEEANNAIHVYYRLKGTVVLPPQRALKATLQGMLQKADHNHETLAEEGDLIEYTVQLQNTGGSSLKLLSINLEGIGDFKIVPELSADHEAILLPGEIREFSSSTVVEESLIKDDVLNCRLLATAQDLNSHPVDASSCFSIACQSSLDEQPTLPVSIHLCHTLRKSRKNHGNLAEKGDRVEIIATVRNEGSRSLKNILFSLKSNQFSIDENPTNVLEQGDEIEFRIDYSIKSKDAAAGVLDCEAYVTAETADGCVCDGKEQYSIEVFRQQFSHFLFGFILLTLAFSTLMAILSNTVSPPIDCTKVEFGYYDENNQYVSLGTEISVQDLDEQIRVYFHCVNRKDEDYDIHTVSITRGVDTIASGNVDWTYTPGAPYQISASVRGTGKYVLIINGNEIAAGMLRVIGN